METARSVGFGSLSLRSNTCLPRRTSTPLLRLATYMMPDAVSIDTLSTYFSDHILPLYTTTKTTDPHSAAFNSRLQYRPSRVQVSIHEPFSLLHPAQSITQMCHFGQSPCSLCGTIWVQRHACKNIPRGHNWCPNPTTGRAMEHTCPDCMARGLAEWAAKKMYVPKRLTAALVMYGCEADAGSQG